MRWRRAGLPVLGALAALAAVPVSPAGTPAARNDIVHSTEVVTPHVPWAKHLPGGPIRGFFIPSISRGRDMVELMQRLSLRPTTVSIDRQWDVNCWGLGDFYGHEERGDRDDFRIVYGYVEEDLTGPAPFDVMVLPGLNGWSRMTRPTRDAILRRVREGAGLVLIHPFVGDVAGHPFKGDEAAGDERLWDLSPLVGVADDPINERGYPVPNPEAIAHGRWEKAGEHFITDGIDFALLARGEQDVYRYQARGDAIIQAGGLPVAAVSTFGRGRVVALAQTGEGLVPDPVDPVATRSYGPYWEHQYALLARAIVWAAGREGDVRLRSLRASEADGLSMGFLAGAARPVEIEIAARSDFGQPLGSHRLRRALDAGESQVAVSAAELRPEAGWPGGRLVLDVIVRDASGATLAWGAASFEVEKPATVASLRPNAAVYRRGDLVSLVTRAAGRLEGLRMRVTFADDLGRVLGVEEKETAGEKYFFHTLDGFVGQRLLVTAELVTAGGRVVDQVRHAPLPVVQRERRRREYQALVSFETPPPALVALRSRLLRARAMTGGFTWGGEVTDSLEIPRGYFGVYWYDRGPTTPEGLEQEIRAFERTGDHAALHYLTKKELYRRTHDPAFLVRNPSLDDPAVLDVLRGVATTSARNKAVYNMDYYFVGDEGSLTSYGDPVDFDWGPHALAGFRKWLRETYGSLAALNAEWRSNFAGWDAVVPATTDEARASGNFPPWADHRTYMEVAFARAYAAVREAVVAGDPQGRIAVSGTQATTPYNGADWYRLDQVIDDFLSYSGGNQWDFHRSFARPGSRVGFWTGYGRSGPSVQHEIWTAAFSGVLHPNLFWSYSVVNPDLTFSKSGRDMGAVFSALRFEGVGRLLMEAERLGDGIAIHYSMPSVHAAGILGLHKAAKGDDEDGGPGFPANRDGWARTLTDLGLSYDFVSSPQIEAGALDPRRTRVLILPLSLALSAKEATAIEAFARAGGIVIADVVPGRMDEHCAWAPAGMLRSLFPVATPPGRTLTSPVDGLAATWRVGKGWAILFNRTFDAYPKLRAKDYGGAEYRDLLRAELERIGIAPAAFVRDAAGKPVPGIRVARYRFGGRDVVGVLAEDLQVAAGYGRDGVTRYDDAGRPAAAGIETVIHLPRVAQVTNVRTGEDLGRTDTVRRTMVPGDALVLSLGDGPRTSLTVTGPPAARLGQKATFVLDAGGRGKRLVRCHVLDPEGRFLPEYAANLLLEDGRGAFELTTAMNDPAGRYRVTATDVITGAPGQAELRLDR